jgi:hypothetical protein
MVQMNELESRPSKHNRTSTELFYKGKWISLSGICDLPEFKGRNLDRSLLYTRWHVQKWRTPDKLFKAKRVHKRHKESEKWVFEGCTPQQIAALKSGTNQALLET